VAAGSERAAFRPEVAGEKASDRVLNGRRQGRANATGQRDRLNPPLPRARRSDRSSSRHRADAMDRCG
jgi:hypothetical protein